MYYIFECSIVLFSQKTDDSLNCILKFKNNVILLFWVDKQKLSHCRFVSDNETYYYDDITKKLTNYTGQEKNRNV